MTTRTKTLAASALLLAAHLPQAAAEVVIDAGGMTVTGQRELPKVLYIVPWKKMQAAEIETPKTGSLVEDVLAPVDPEIFKIRLQYFDILSANNTPGGSD